MSRLHRAREKLRGRYLSRLPASIESLRDALNASPPDRHTIATLAHKLRGSGGTYGFGQITDAAVLVQRASEERYLGAVKALIETCEAIIAVEADVELDAEPSNGGPSVLVVDDDTSIREILAVFLDTLGYSARLARSLAEADDELGRGEPGLVILDMMLPDGSGLDLLPRIPRHVPTLVLTMEDNEDTRQRALELGARGYLHKPFEPTPFELRLRQVVDPTVQDRAKAHAKG